MSLSSSLTGSVPQVARPPAPLWSSRQARFLIPAGVAAAIVSAWALAAWVGWFPAFLLPSPHKVAQAFAELNEDGLLLDHIGVSMLRLGAGYGLSVLLALPLAFLVSSRPLLARLTAPMLEFLRQIPPLAMMPLLILWLGIGETQKIGVIVLACFFPVFLSTVGGITQCDPKLVEVGRVAGLSQRSILWRIVLPSALPSVVVGLRIALGQGWRALVGAELVASAAGLGYMIVDAENLARTDIVMVGILVIGVLGMTTDWLARRAISAAAPWVDAREGGTHAHT